MSIVTYDSVSSAAAARGSVPREINVAARSEPKGFWARVFDRMVEARMRRAEEELRRYHHRW